MIFDSYYDTFRGVIALFRVFNGTIKRGDEIYFMNTQCSYEVNELGVLRLEQLPKEEISAGNVGYLRHPA